VPIEKLRAFYDTYYWPNNATVTIIGDFDTATALGLHFEGPAISPRRPGAHDTRWIGLPGKDEIDAWLSKRERGVSDFRPRR
jgi:N-acetylglucosamine-6-phosphate deacetylase